MQNNPIEIEFISSISQIEPLHWNHLAKGSGPFLQHSFLAALENSNSVCADSGWQPQHLIAYQNKAIVGILPLYIKSHSYGEYVFDFAWANAYQQHGMDYYPKLVSAIPFTPVTGKRLMLADDGQESIVLPAIVDAVKVRMDQLDLSSVHWLFVDKETQSKLTRNGLLPRQSVQFQWANKGYKSFTQFLESFTARRRKMVKKERAKIDHAGFTVRRISGKDIKLQDIHFFYRCYQQTYLKRSGHSGYLKHDFFIQVYQTMVEQMLLVVAEKGNRPIAAALYFFDQEQLCGRYWGALEESDGLHFECCYYQGIEFCIENNVGGFNPGTQGEHKILRGFEPIFCYSSHFLKDPDFHNAVDRFLQNEGPQIELYQQQTQSLLPFKQDIETNPIAVNNDSI
jgi:predicted N-acyltransferase